MCRCATGSRHRPVKLFETTCTVAAKRRYGGGRRLPSMRDRGVCADAAHIEDVRFIVTCGINQKTTALMPERSTATGGAWDRGVSVAATALGGEASSDSSFEAPAENLSNPTSSSTLVD